MFNLSAVLWRLIPANPILLRVVEGGGKRVRDLVIRCLYLGILVLVVLFLLGNTSGSLSELSIQSSRIFGQLSYLQLLLVALLAPIFTAGAITQEQDSQTYDILLATPLTNGQIVLGSLLSRLFFVFALLLSGVPIFSITQVFGGVAIGDIVLSVAIAAVTALITGALAIAIATFKVGTRRTIFSFYLFNVLYLVGLLLLDNLESLRVPLDAGLTLPIGARPIGWLAPFQPFLALRSVLDPVHYVTPGLGQLPPGLRGWPTGWMLTHPIAFYLSFMSLLSFVLVLPSIVLLRRMAQMTTSIQPKLLKLLPFAAKLEKTRKARTVWANPIAWREAKTKASASRSTVLRVGFILFGTAAAIAIVVGYASESATPRQYVGPGSYSAADSTVFVRGANEANYRVDANTQVRMAQGFTDSEGNKFRAASLDDVNHRFAISSLNVATVITGRNQSAKILRGIDLAPIDRRINARDARRFLLGLVLVEVTAILLIITNAAASTVTREKEDGTLDLLLCTPITSRFYIWGKVRGLIAYVMPLLAVPVSSCAMFVLYDAWRALRGDATFDWTVLPEAVVLLPTMLVVVMAFASIVGMQMSLRCRTTVWAVMSSVGIMLGVCGALGWCGFALLSNNRFNDAYVAIGSFSPITVLMMLIAPKEVISDPDVGPALAGTARVMLSVFTLAATGAYAALVWSLYGSMVKNFDMTIRKQSR